MDGCLFATGRGLYKITGKENFINGENYIVISNHNSFMDVPVLSPYIPGPNKTIAKIEMARIPFLEPYINWDRYWWTEKIK